MDKSYTSYCGSSFQSFSFQASFDVEIHFYYYFLNYQMLRYQQIKVVTQYHPLRIDSFLQEKSHHFSLQTMPF